MPANKKFKSSLLAKCASVMIIGFIMSFLTVTVFAASVQGSKWTFNVGAKEYENYSKLTYSSSSDWFIGGTSINCNTSSCAAGYLGAKPNIYKQNSNGTYSIVASGVWRYTTEGCWGYTNGATTYSSPDSGLYMCQGQSAVYYNGGYQTDWTYTTPFININ